MKIKGSSGFTLIELMVTTAVVAILLSAGVPAFSAMVKSNRLVTETYALRSMLSAARSEAQAQRTTVKVCRSVNGINCSTGKGNWGAGYIAFIDLDGDDQLDEADEQLLQSRVQDTQGVVVQYSQASDALLFDSNGNALGSNGTFTFCDDRGAAKARGLIISAVGAVRAAVASQADGSSHIVQDDSGVDVSCS